MKSKEVPHFESKKKNSNDISPIPKPAPENKAHNGVNISEEGMNGFIAIEEGYGHLQPSFSFLTTPS